MNHSPRVVFSPACATRPPFRPTRLGRSLRVLAWALAAFLVVALFESATDLDLRLQRLCFDGGTWWLTPADHARLKVFYTGPKVLIALLGGAALCTGLASFHPAFTARLARWRRPCLFLALAVALGPLIVALCKHYSGIG